MKTTKTAKEKEYTVGVGVAAPMTVVSGAAGTGNKSPMLSYNGAYVHLLFSLLCFPCRITLFGATKQRCAILQVLDAVHGMGTDRG